MQVKIFKTVNDEERLERFINHWLEQNPKIKIENIIQTQSGRMDAHLFVTIWYTC